MKHSLLLFLSIIITGNSLKSQVKWDESFTPFINQLTSTDPACHDDSDLSVLDAFITDKKVVSFGEATHGTKEFFTSKHRLLKYLVENHAFKVFVIEDDYTLSCKVNEFVTGTIDTRPEQLLSASWMAVWRTQEVLDMLLWIKSYNLNKKEEEKVKIYGCDMHFRAASKYLLERLEQDNLLDKEVEKGLNFLVQYRRSDKMTKTQKSKVKTLVNQLENIGKNTSDKHLSLCIKTLIQSIDLLNKGVVSGTITRDKYMADNCISIYEIEKQKMMIWAHNQHVAEKSDVSKKKPMGEHLKDHFGDDVYTIGFGFYTGEYFAFDPKKRRACTCKAGIPMSDCIDHLFAKAPYENFMLDLGSQNLPLALERIIHNTGNTRRAGSLYNSNINAKTNYRKSILAKSYDLLLFIRNSNATTRLPYTP